MESTSTQDLPQWSSSPYSAGPSSAWAQGDRATLRTPFPPDISPSCTSSLLGRGEPTLDQGSPGSFPALSSRWPTILHFRKLEHWLKRTWSFSQFLSRKIVSERPQAHPRIGTYLQQIQWSKLDKDLGWVSLKNLYVWFALQKLTWAFFWRRPCSFPTRWPCPQPSSQVASPTSKSNQISTVCLDIYCGKICHPPKKRLPHSGDSSR